MPPASSVVKPYQIIADRNVFGLRPAPLGDLRPPAPPLPEIILTGISTIEGRKLALLKVEFPTKPFQPPKADSCILAEGQRDGPVEVLQINLAPQSVKVNNSGITMLLTFEKNGPKPMPPLPPRFPVRRLPFRAAP